MRRAALVAVLVALILPAHAHAITTSQVCYFSGGPNHTPQHTPYYPMTIAPWTGVAAPAATTGPWYGSSGCAGDGTRVGIMSHACNDPDCVSVSPIRTAQIIYTVPSLSANRTWTVTTDVRIVSRVTPWQVAQTVFFWISLYDYNRGRHVWYSVILWDSRGSAVFGMPGVIFDRQAGGGTDAMNVIGLLAGGYSRYVTQTGGLMSNNAAGGVFQFKITPQNMAAALTDISSLDPTYSTNPADYTVTAASVDFEAFRQGGGPDFCGLVVNSMSLT